MRWAKSSTTEAVWLAIVAGILLSSGVAWADFVFGEPDNMGAIINGSGIDASQVMTPDGLQLYYGSDREGGLGEVDIWVSSRSTRNDEWEPPVNLGPNVNSPAWDLGPSLSADGLTLYFASGRQGNPANLDFLDLHLKPCHR